VSERGARRLAYGLGGAAVLLTVGGLALGAKEAGVAAVGLALVALTYGVSGAVLASRRPGNAIGWIMTAIGVSESILVIAAGYAAFAQEHWPSAPFTEVAAWTGNWIWTPGLGAVLTFLLLLFPDGHPPSPRWRWVMWAAGIGMVVGTIGSAVGLWSARWIILSDPNRDVSPTGIGGAIGGTGLFLLFGVAGIASIVSVVVRWRRAVGDERQQLRWFLMAAVVVAVGFLAGLPGSSNFQLLFAGMLLLPISIAVAVMKYRLYDLDVVIKKTVVFTVVVVVLTGLYLSVLALATTGTGVARYLLGALLLLVTFGPVRRGARLVADRIVYGRRASSYEVLSEFSGRMADTYATDDVLPRMAQILAAATGAARSTVWLHLGGELRPAASFEGETEGASDPTTGQGVATAEFDDLSVEVRHQGELLGALSVAMPANDPLDPSRERLVRDLAAQAGLVLRNVRLIEELKASRQRLVAAQDEERRKLERNIHDGAQQQLVALAVKLKLLGTLASRDPDKAADLAAQLQTEATDALENLRDLARGIYPPLLADKGLVAALQAQARKAAVPTTVEGNGIGRFGQDVEAAVYFSCLEALQNVAKYANASRATIALSNGGGALTFTVTDDGAGFDRSSTSYGTGLQGVADRLAALGGALDVRSVSGSGTTVAGRLPAEAAS